MLLLLSNLLIKISVHGRPFTFYSYAWPDEWVHASSSGLPLAPSDLRLPQSPLSHRHSSPNSNHPPLAASSLQSLAVVGTAWRRLPLCLSTQT
jgi:hypothetical protein